MVQQNQPYPEIQKELIKQFGEHAYKKSAVYHLIQEAKFGFSEEEETSSHEKHIDEQLLITIQQEIEKNEFFQFVLLLINLTVNQV